MSVTRIQVHLPSFSNSFSIFISSDSTILDFKHEVSRICIGSPKAAGQRIIYKGRVLDDTEIVGQVWKTTDEPHTCHLAVHPSAWTTTPPNSQPPISTTPSLSPTPSHQIRVPATNVPLPQIQAHTTYSYIQYIHTNALRILARQPRLPWPEQLGDKDNALMSARRGVEATGRGWPSFLNLDFYGDVPEPDEGVKYASTYIDNLPYLSLLTPDATPTALQTQAIRALSYTFPLLCVYPSAQGQHNNPLQVNAIPPRPLAPLGLQMHIPIRPLIVPLILLTIRTTLLLYFFQPARKPFFGLMVLIWVMWEVAGAVRGALGGEHGNANGVQNNRDQRAENVDARAGVEAGVAAGVGARPAVNNNATQPAVPNTQDAILNHLAQLNLSYEARFVEPDSAPNPNAPPPSFLHKIKMFFTLLFLTLHPAVWDRRRSALRAREARVREEARIRDARALQRERERVEREENRRRGVEEPITPPGNTLAETPEITPAAPPKPFWIAEYVQRVRSGDWVDD